jgi:predicted metal-dependent enzyme (double-stranded beta helix superfamily)
MTESAASGIERLIGRLDGAVGPGAPERVALGVKAALEELVRGPGIRLPDRFQRCAGSCYARRLLHRDPETGYTVVAMTWGPGQRTQLHDHAGIWCVECVVEGRLLVTQYDLTERQDGRYRFEERSCVTAGVGDAGCLIPPSEYHVMHNPCDRDTAISLHVYGGEMERCNLYVPQDGGWWERQAKSLSYDH